MAFWDFLNRLLDKIERWFEHRKPEPPLPPLVGRSRHETPRQRLRRRMGLNRR